MKKVKFKGGLKRQHNEGTLGGESVPLKIYKRNKPKPKKTKNNWEKLKDWFYRFIY